MDRIIEITNEYQEYGFGVYRFDPDESQLYTQTKIKKFPCVIIYRKNKELL